MLSTVDLSLTLSEKEYEESLIKYQVALFRLAYQVYTQQRPVVIVFEGWDAAGKGGVIRRLTEKLDPRGFVVYSIAAPKGDEATHQYLWRFWTRLPDCGQIAIFDRSWYGRVMVERIEGFCTEAEWKRSYREINYFERQLVNFGTIIFKFWLHISPEEQLARFQSRSGDKLRSWKLTDEDWRNREKWGQYQEAVNEMLLKTSTTIAPWTVVEGNSKPYARIKTLRTVVEKLSQELKYDPFESLPESEKKSRKKKKNKS
jgi:polyphosphate kinase 2 (PPK2 family)